MLKFDHFIATQILCEIKLWWIQKVQKRSFLAILEVLNFDFRKFEQLSSPKFTKIQSSESLELPNRTFLDRLNSPKLDFTQNRSGSKRIKFWHCQALTSHFESFWSIVCGLKILQLFQMACLTTCWVTGFVMTSLTLLFVTYCENCQCLDPSIAWTTTT